MNNLIVLEVFVLVEKSSRIPGFYKLSVEERLRIVKEWAGLSDEEVELLRNFGSLGEKTADIMIENVIGGMTYPFAVAVNFRVNGRDVLVPMVIEEPSVVAAASNGARFMREGKGIISIATEPIMIGQIHVVGVDNPYYRAFKILESKDEILKIATDACDKILLKLGGGPRDLEVRVLDTEVGKTICVHILVDVRDAMGANTVNTIAEAVAPTIERITGGRVVLRIISNLADKRLVRAMAVVSKEAIGEEVVDGIIEAWAIAAADPYRAATHNKGIMNGIIAVALATAQDHRAIEAGAHAYAARSGRYTTLTRWGKNERGDLVGILEMPMAVGMVGGAIRTHPIARIALKILGVKTAKELAEIMGAVGLAQNFAALRALVTEGIQRGHMKLHARNLAVMAGAPPDMVDLVVEKLIREGRISFDRAKEIVEELMSKRSS